MDSEGEPRISMKFSSFKFDEKFEDGTSESKAYNYEMGYDSAQIDTILVKNLLQTSS